MVHTSGSDLVEVILGNPRSPMVFKSRTCLICAECLTVGIFLRFISRSGLTLSLSRHTINHIVWCGFKNAGSDPRFEDKPTTEVDASHLVVAEAELQAVISLERYAL